MLPPRVRKGAPDRSDGDEAAIFDEEPNRGSPTRLTRTFHHLLKGFLQNVKVAGVEVGEDVGADDIPGEVTGEGDCGVAGPTNPALRCVRRDKVLVLQPRWNVGRNQWCGHDK